MVEPISPHEVSVAKAKALPDKVLEVWNKLIATAWDGRKAVVLQPDAVTALKKAGFINVARQGFLDIEPVYEAKGWKVEYDKPGYNESYDANFTFTKASTQEDRS